jgi:hypothetical protein
VWLGWVGLWVVVATIGVGIVAALVAVVILAVRSRR